MSKHYSSGGSGGAGKGPKSVKPLLWRQSQLPENPALLPLERMRWRLALALGREYDRGELSWEEFTAEMEALDATG